MFCTEKIKKRNSSMPLPSFTGFHRLPAFRRHPSAVSPSSLKPSFKPSLRTSGQGAQTARRQRAGSGQTRAFDEGPLLP